MTVTNDPSIPPTAPVNVMDPPTLEDLITKWQKEGITLELIVAMIMSNPEGLGAMDVVSNNIAGITKQSNILSKVQSDIITLNSILSKIESQLGTKAQVDQASWDKFSKTLLTQFQTTYKNLFEGDKDNPNGDSDLKALEAYKSEFPSLDAIISSTNSYQGDFKDMNGTNFENDVLNWDGKNTSLNGTPFVKDITFMAAQHYSANHPDSDGHTSGATDYLQNWWTDGNADQQLVSGQTQQNTTQVQSYMQLLQGFDSSAQQDIQLASTQKSQIIQNEKTS